MQNKTMTTYDEAIRDNPERQTGEVSQTDESLDGVMSHLEGSVPQAVVLDASDPDVQWDDDSLWFDCPNCGDRLCSAWFFQAGSKCEGCGASVTIQIAVEWAE